MGAANMGSAVSALAKAVAGVGMIGALLFIGWQPGHPRRTEARQGCDLIDSPEG
jgi:hypothetical protein